MGQSSSYAILYFGERSVASFRHDGRWKENAVEFKFRTVGHLGLNILQAQETHIAPACYVSMQSGNVPLSY